MHEGFAIGSFQIIDENLHVQQAPGETGRVTHDSERRLEFMVDSKTHFPSRDGDVGKLRWEFVRGEPDKERGKLDEKLSATPMKLSVSFDYQMKKITSGVFRRTKVKVNDHHRSSMATIVQPTATNLCWMIKLSRLRVDSFSSVVMGSGGRIFSLIHEGNRRYVPVVNTSTAWGMVKTLNRA